jgi:PIN domain nuclease of toxin-antitoxin system
LLDTHTAIWALESPELLTASALEAVLSGPNVLSVVSYWEVMLKSMKGRLDVGDPRSWWLDALPPIHKDPFDRMLIAQAASEGLALVSCDSEIARYASKTLRMIV